MNGFLLFLCPDTGRKEGTHMATTRIMPLHAGKGRTAGKAISDIIDYVKNPERPTTAGSSPAISVTAA